MEDEEDAPIKTPAERGLTIETFANRPLVGDKALLAKLKPLVKDWDGVKNKIEQSMEHLQDTASTLNDAGMMEDEELFESIDQNFRELLDELAFIEIRREELNKIFKALGEDEDEVADAQGIYRAGCKEMEQEYRAKSAKQKYAKSARYKTFRQAVWDSRAMDRGMPPMSALFANDARKEDEGSDSDSDIEAGGVTQSFKCPLSLKTFVDPWSSTICPHSYEKGEIHAYLRKKAAHCPVSGCDALLDLSKIKANKNLKKRVEADTRRNARAREDRENSADEIESDED
ncbi:zinc-finger of the MIZ type in Nse subunit-domain-containing protein [Mrakia frigida]|uniref:NSE2 family E3 SUMO-protein ligase n=1 Tax=Mrakia frigida TaxID=29902 RepID=UPI003FCBF877